MFCTCISGGVVTKTLRKRAITALIFTMTMIYLSISVSAVGTFDSEAKVITYKLTGSATNGLSWQDVTTSGNLEYTSGTTTYEFALYNGFKVNQVPQDGYILVCTIVLGNIDKSTVSLKGVGQLTSNTLFSKSGSISSTNLSAIPLNQEIIASTVENYEGQVRLTVTFKAQGFQNQYPVVKWQFKKTSTTLAIPYSDCQLYETLDQAAGSGVTPEEMREVLSSWGEEELLPGIQDSVQSGVTSGMEAALEDEKQQASSGAQGGLDELAGALSGVTEDITQAKQSFETLGSALSYSGTSASLTFPAMTVPFLGTISEAQPINLTEQIDNIMPPTLLLIIRCALSIGIVSYPIFELITQLRKLLDKG